jgi:AhpC/TSA antioxidant enzyme
MFQTRPSSYHVIFCFVFQVHSRQVENNRLRNSFFHFLRNPQKEEMTSTQTKTISGETDKSPFWQSKSGAYWRTCSRSSSTSRQPTATSTMSLDLSVTVPYSSSIKSSLISRADGADVDIIRKTQLTPIDCSFGIVTDNIFDKVSFSSMLIEERKRLTLKRDSGVMLVFAIRRPGCASCRLNGRILTDIARKENVGCVGIIKETGVADAHLIGLYHSYFRHPIYKDENWRIYEAMGNRKMSVFKLLGKLPKLSSIYKKQNIENIPFGGDLLTQGGVLVFDRDGNLRFTFYERYGEFFDETILKQVIEEAKNPVISDTSSISSESDNIRNTNRIAI